MYSSNFGFCCLSLGSGFIFGVLGLGQSGLDAVLGWMRVLIGYLFISGWYVIRIPRAERLVQSRGSRIRYLMFVSYLILLGVKFILRIC